MQLPLVNLSLPSDVVERLASLVSDSLGVRTARIVTDLMLMYFPVFYRRLQGHYSGVWENRGATMGSGRRYESS